MARHRYEITLRVRHPVLTAAEVCAVIPLEPGRTWTVGEPRKTPKGAPLEGHYEESYCTFPMQGGIDEIAVGLALAVERLAPQSAFFRETWAAGGRAELFIGWFIAGGNSGDAFEPALLAKLGDLGLQLSFDVYPKCEG